MRVAWLSGLIAGRARRWRTRGDCLAAALEARRGYDLMADHPDTPPSARHDLEVMLDTSSDQLTRTALECMSACTVLEVGGADAIQAWLRRVTRRAEQ